MTELLKQGQFSPLDVVEEVLVIFAGTRGYLDKVPVNQVAAWEKGFLKFIHEQKSEIYQKIASSKDLDDQTIVDLGNAIKDFQAQFKG